MNKMLILLIFINSFSLIGNNISLNDNNLKNNSEKILLKNTNLDEVSFEYNSSISDSDFKIIYDNSYVSHSEAANILTFCEDLKVSTMDAGFRENYNNSVGSVLEIKINPNYRKDNVVGTTTSSPIFLSNKASASIEIFGETSLNYNMKSTIVHEYFHSIQYNYNFGNSDVKWFMEACATRAEFKFYDDSRDPYTYIKNLYLNKDKDTSMNLQQGYGTVIYPLTLSMLYGDNIIKDIFEKLNNYSFFYTFNDLKNVINASIKTYDDNGSFDSIYNKMSSFLVSYDKWDNNYLKINLNNDDFEHFYQPEFLLPESNVSKNITVYNTNYYEITLNENVNEHDIKAIINTDSSNSIVQIYTIDNVGNHNINSLISENNCCEFTFSKFGFDIKKAYIIVNSNSSSFNYSVQIDYVNHSYVGHNCKDCNYYVSSHNYNYSYSSISKTQHYANCSCGEQIKEAHVVSASSNGLIKYCLLCGGQGVVGIGKFDTISVYQESYVSSNGVIVLNDEDVTRLKRLNNDIKKLLEEVIYNA